MIVEFPRSHVVLVCGGTAPLGAAIAAEMAKSGSGQIIIAGRDRGRGDAMLAELRGTVPTAAFDYLPVDLSDHASTAAMFEQVKVRFGGLNSYVHCVPPGGASGMLAVADLDRFRASLSSGLGSLAESCRLAAGLMAERGGCILTFSSDAGRIASPGHALIATVQSGIMALTRSLALELARDQIRVNCISPTYVQDTPMFDRLMQSPAIARAIDKAKKRAGLGLPSPADIAPLAAFLLSASAAKITGQIVSVNGGLSAA